MEEKKETRTTMKIDLLTSLKFASVGKMWGKFRVYGEIKKCCKLLSYSTLLFVETSALWYKSYPDPGSNRDGLPHWCLRPARLPIPPSGLVKRMQRYE